jgi:hypothetical protein
MPLPDAYLRLNRFIDMEWEKLAASLEWFQGAGVPALSQTPGWRTLFFGVNPDRGQAAGITFWDSLSAVRASETTEAEFRAEALTRAGGETSKGIVEQFQIVVEVSGKRKPAWARLLRWSGLTAARILDGLLWLEEDAVPALRKTSGFAGMFAGANFTAGSTMGVYLWDSPKALQAGIDWEREAAAVVEDQVGPDRPIFADTYQVALVPELRRLVVL